MRHSVMNISGGREYISRGGAEVRMRHMVNADYPVSQHRIRSRQIEDSDVTGIVALLTQGFADRRPRRFWERVLDRLAHRPAPAGLPKYGYLMQSDGVTVGALLQIFSTMHSGGAPATRCNVSSWYVEPAFRSYAPLLVSQALNRPDITYLNISSAPHTRPIVETHGYTRYSNGVFVATPSLGRTPAGETPRIVGVQTDPDAYFEPYERQLLLDHAGYGCISLWCIASGRAHPFVFRPRFAKGLIPYAQLIYCREVDDFVRYSRPLSVHLALRGRPFVVIDSNGPIRELAGKYIPGVMPKYFRGPDRPRLGDLAHTEAALFGV
jgi:hypothetical protein